MYSDFGDVFTIDFDIRVNVMPTTTLNVFQFTDSYGDDNNNDYSLPTVMVNPDSSLRILTSLNNNANYGTDFNFILERLHHVTIKQFKENNRIWYEIIIDGETIEEKVENKNFNKYPTVNLMLSNNVQDSFTSEYGYVCNLKVGK